MQDGEVYGPPGGVYGPQSGGYGPRSYYKSEISFSYTVNILFAFFYKLSYIILTLMFN